MIKVRSTDVTNEGIGFELSSPEAGKYSVAAYEVTADGKLDCSKVCIQGKDIVLADLFEVNAAVLFSVNQGRLVESKLSMLKSSREDLYQRETLNKINMYQPIAILFGSTASEFVMYINGAVVTELPVEVATAGQTVDQVITAANPALGEVLVKDQARRKILRALDPSTSLSYLEAQTDLMAKLLFAVYDNAGAAAQTAIKAAVPELDDLRNALSTTSVLTVKGPAAAVAEITENKAAVRTAQQEYYAAK